MQALSHLWYILKQPFPISSAFSLSCFFVFSNSLFISESVKSIVCWFSRATRSSALYDQRSILVSSTYFSRSWTLPSTSENSFSIWWNFSLVFPINRFSFPLIWSIAAWVLLRSAACPLPSEFWCLKPYQPSTIPSHPFSMKPAIAPNMPLVCFSGTFRIPVANFRVLCLTYLGQAP